MIFKKTISVNFIFIYLSEQFLNYISDYRLIANKMFYNKLIIN